MPLLASFLSPMDMAIIAVLAVLLFGDRLAASDARIGPGRDGIQKGMREIEDQIESATRLPDTAHRTDSQKAKSPPFRNSSRRHPRTASRRRTPAKHPRRSVRLA